jgi:hypothetical protein
MLTKTPSRTARICFRHRIAGFSAEGAATSAGNLYSQLRSERAFGLLTIEEKKMSLQSLDYFVTSTFVECWFLLV